MESHTSQTDWTTRASCPAEHIPLGFTRLLCTRMLTTHHCAIPRGHGHFKWPSLQETHCLLVKDKVPCEIFTPPTCTHHSPCTHDQHDARGDVHRCREVLSQTVAPAHFPDEFLPDCPDAFVWVS